MRGCGGWARAGWLALTTTVVHVWPAALSAQSPVRPDTGLPAGTILGSVVVAQTDAPLEDAVVVLEPAPQGALIPARGSSFWDAGRATHTDASGTYHFDRLAAGAYRLSVRRLGYRPASLEIELGGESAFRVSVGLVVAPIALEPVQVPGAAAAPVVALRADADALARQRLAAEAERRRRFLVSDARTLTSADLTEAVTLGETDLFRALQRLPSVATRDDYTAELWTRGSRWTDTRVTFDGLPLFSPLHVGGVVSGVDPDAVGSAFFHPGVRPASSGEGDAATLDLASRPAAEPGLHGLTELSVISARAALERGADGGGVGWMLAARRSYVDLASQLIAALKKDSTVVVPYAFTDLTGRLDVPLGGGGDRAIAVSGLWAQDALHGTVPNLLQRSRGHWGDAVLQATFTTPLAGLAARVTAGVSRFDVSVDDTTAFPGASGSFRVPFSPRTRSGITYVMLAGAVGPRSGEAWAAGYQIVSQRLSYAGTAPTTHPDSGLFGPARQFGGAASVLALWGERRWNPLLRLAIRPGLRVELGTPVAGAPDVRVAPRIEARYLVGSGALALSAGYGRSFQFTQAVGPTGPAVGPELHLSEVWLLAGDSTPAIRADVGTVGAELGIGEAWSAALNGYLRRATGVAVPDPTPGQVLSLASLVPAVNVARGAELSLRKLAGRWTGSASLAFNHSALTASGLNYPSPSERPMVLHATALLRARGALRLGGAVTAASGAYFTRFVGSIEQWQPGLVPYAGLPYAEAPGAARAPGYTTLDLLFDWTHETRAWTLGAYVQLRNALGATNAATYAGSVEGCVAPQPPTKVQVRPGVCDYYVRGLPRLPLAGVRVSF